MPSNTADQQITLPIGADSADNPVAFIDSVADIEPRLVREYTDAADRTARMLALTENDFSTLATENRAEIYDGANHISLHARADFASLLKSADQNLTLSSTALQDVTELVVALPTAGTFWFRGIVWYSTSATADIKFAFNFPAGAQVRWNGCGVSTAGGAVGDGNFAVAFASDGTLSYGGAGVGGNLTCRIEGNIAMGGTAGNLQFRAAQDVSEATQSVVHQGSRLEVWRVV